MYSAGQVGLPGDPNRIVNVYRPESEVNNPAAIESFKEIPFIDDHMMLSGFADDDVYMAPEDYGVEGFLTSNVYYEAPWLRGDLKVLSRRLQDYLSTGKEDLSLGYGCKYVVQSGTFDGQDYEVVQTNLRGNHIALVGEGRVKGARVLDGQTFCYDHLKFETINSAEGKNMAVQVGKKKPGAKTAPALKVRASSAQDNALEALKALIPQIEQMCGSTQAEPAKDDIVQTEAGQVAAEPAAPLAGDPDSDNPADAPQSTDVEALVNQIQALMAQLQSAATGEVDNGEQAADGTDPGTQGIDEDGQKAADEDDAESDQGEDSDSLPAAIENGQGKASPGPAAGINAKAADSALRGFYADLAAKDRLYKRVSAVVGAFNSGAMDSAEVGAYGVKKLGLSCAKGQEVSVLDAYFKGLDEGKKGIVQRKQQVAQDSAENASEVDAYIKGAK